MKDKFVLQFTKRPESDRDLSLGALLRLLRAYFRKVFTYAGAQIRRRRHSYRSMIVVSVVLLTFVFTNLILNEARIMAELSQDYGGIHHVVFLGVDGAAAKGAVSHDAVKDSIIIPVIAELESSVDTSTVGKVAVLTEEIASFMQVGMTHGDLPGDDEIIVPRNLYSVHDFLILGEKQDMFFESDTMAYEYMSLGGLYSCTDENSPYVFVNEATGEKIKAATGHSVTFDVNMTLKIASDRNAAKVAGEIIRQYGLRDTAEQQLVTNAGDERTLYRDYINEGAATHRDKNSVDINSIASMAAVVIAALIMASFLTDYTERHIAEYGILAAYGAKRSHLLGVVMGQVLFVTLLSLLPVLLLSFGGAYLYNYLYNQARLASSLPRLVTIPLGALAGAAVWYVVLLCFFCVLTMGRMLSQLPYPMLRGMTGGKLPFVRRSSALLMRVRDKVRHIALLQSLRLVKRNVIPSIATSLICVVCAIFLGAGVMSLPLLNAEALTLGNRSFDGDVAAVDSAFAEDGIWHGFVSAAAVEILASFDGVSTVGGLRTQISSDEYGSVDRFELVIDEAHAACSDYASTQYYSARHPNYDLPADILEEQLAWYEDVLRYGVGVRYTPYYCDRTLLPYLYRDVWEGDPNDIYTVPNSVILVENNEAAYRKRTADGSQYHVGDRIAVRIADDRQVDLTVVAVVSGNYMTDFGITISENCVILSAETGEVLDGFPATLRQRVYFMYDDDLTDEEYADLSERIGGQADMVRYDVTFYATERLRATRMAELEGAVTAVFFLMLYVSMCVLDYYHASESILSQRREFCPLRQMGARKRAVYKTTRTSVYAGQFIAFGVTLALAFVAFLAVNGYCANLSNMYRMNFEGRPDVLAEMLALVRELQRLAYEAIGGILLLSIPLHGLAFLTAILGTVLPTRRIMKENIAAVLKGSAEI